MSAGLQAVRERLAAACHAQGRSPESVELVAVSKKQPSDVIRAAYDNGQRLFGENRVQELIGKAQELEELHSLRWHFIGSLQTNKVKELLRVAHLDLLHSLDRVRLADELQRELERTDRRLLALLQIHATGEAAKHGCPPGEAQSLLEHVVSSCPRLEVCGLMAMGPLDGDSRPAFELVASLRDELAAQSGLPLPHLSLGMSHDLEVGIAAQATMVRVGSAVFGPRPPGAVQ